MSGDESAEVRETPLQVVSLADLQTTVEGMVKQALEASGGSSSTPAGASVTPSLSEGKFRFSPGHPG